MVAKRIQKLSRGGPVLLFGDLWGRCFGALIGSFLFGFRRISQIRFHLSSSFGRALWVLGIA